MATSMSDFANNLFGINKFEEFQIDVLNKLLELLLTPVKWHWESVSSWRRNQTHDPRYTVPLLYQLS